MALTPDEALDKAMDIIDRYVPLDHSKVRQIAAAIALGLKDMYEKGQRDSLNAHTCGWKWTGKDGREYTCSLYRGHDSEKNPANRIHCDEKSR